jgi:hypothetical protein
MSDSENGGGAGLQALIDRAMPFVVNARTRLGEHGMRRIAGLFWILLLLGTLPAVRAELLFPPSWIAQLGGGLNLAGSANVFGYFAFLIAAAIAVLAVVLRRAAYFSALVPYVLLGASTFASGQVLAILQNVYALGAFVTFLYFIVAGRTRSFYFFVYVAALAVAERFDPLLTWDRIATFVAVSIVLSLLYETWRQNRPMLRELGRENAFGMFLRTLWLWSPTIFLIAIGLTISNWMTNAAEEMIYDGTFVERRCSAAAVPDAEGNPQQTQVPCPATGSWLDEAEIEDLTNEGGSRTCRYVPYVEASRNRVVDDRTIEASSPPPDPIPCPDTAFADTYDVERDDPELGEITVTLSRYPIERLPFETSLDLSVARQFEVIHWRAEQELDSVDRAALSQSRHAGPEARELFGVVPQMPGITIESCVWYDIKCHIVGAVKRSLINAYVRVRTRVERGFVNEMQERADGIAAGVTGTTADIDVMLEQHITEWSDLTRDSIARVFTVWRVLNVIAILWLIVIALKSFLYVFGRVVFDRKTDVYFDLADDDTAFRQGTVKAVNEVTIPGDYGHDIYYKSNYQPLGPAPRFSIPQAFAAALSRIRYGAWNLSRISMPCDDERGLTFNSVQADYLVDWEMQEGEEIVFSYNNFVAMNENVELRTIVSLRVSSLLLGRFVFHSARCKGGPGRLILRTRGRPATAEQVRRSIPLPRLIAWNTFARFSVDSHLTHADIFLNGFNLRRSDATADGRPTGIVVVEADAREGSLLFGTLRFAKHFLLPV